MPFPPSVSVRRHLKSALDHPTEPTTTLVLTSPLRRFVDVRVLLPAPITHATTTAELLGLALEAPGPPVDSLDALDWAFAGTAARVPPHKVLGKMIPARAIWTHLVDTRRGLEESRHYPDSGDMLPMRGEGGEELELERGVDIDPATLQELPYEELWAEVPADWEEGRLRRPDLPLRGKGVCVVLEMEGEGVRGMVVRIGRFCQGIVRRGDAVRVERWFARGEGAEERPEMLVGAGTGQLPCTAAMGTGERELVEGDSLEAPFQDWKVLEIFVGNV